MLYTKSVRSSTLDLIKELQRKKYLDGFYLVGGTALALYYGHRESIDIDLFLNKTFDGIRLLSKRDLIAMKLNAISVSGQRSKDFIDIFYTLNDFTITEILTCYKEKYEQVSVSHIIKSLIYFDDVDLADWPVLLSDPDLKWATVKERLEKEVMAYIS